VKKYGFSHRTQDVQTKFLQGVKSILEKGQKRAKGPNESFGTSKCYLGPNFSSLAPNRPLWQPCFFTLELSKVHQWTWAVATWSGS